MSRCKVSIDLISQSISHRITEIPSVHGCLVYYHHASVAQWQSSGFVNRRSRVQVPSLAGTTIKKKGIERTKMGKLIRLIEDSTSGASMPLGFRAKTSANTITQIPIIGSVENATDLKVAIKLPLDAILFNRSTDGSKKLTQERHKNLNGTRLDNPKEGTMKAVLKEKWDFMVFPYKDFPVNILKDVSVDRVLSIPLDILEAQARVVDLLPIEAIYIDTGFEQSPTLRSTISLSATRSVIDKPCLISTNTVLSISDLEYLRDIGIDAIIMNLKKFTAQSGEKFLANLTELPKRKPRENKSSPIIPAVNQGDDGYEENDEYEESATES